MTPKFCRAFCGQCADCLAAKAEVDRLDAILATLSDEDANSLVSKDPDDPHTFALDHKGRP